MNEQEEPHENKDLLSFVGTGEGTTKDESSISCPICFEGIIQTLPGDTVAEGLASLRGTNHYEFVCAIGQPEVSQPRLGGCMTGSPWEDAQAARVVCMDTNLQSPW